MKKGLIIGIVIAVVVVAGGCGVGAYEYGVSKNVTLNSKIESGQKADLANGTKIDTSSTVKANNKISIAKALATQGIAGSTMINNEKFGTITVGSASNGNETLATVPNAGKDLGINKTFTKATVGANESVSGNGATFNVVYNGTSGWSISYNGQADSNAKRFTTKYIPKIIATSASTGYLYSPASSATEQGFLIGYNLKNPKDVFNWFVTINDQSKSLPRLNSLGLGNLMLNGDFGFYANPTGAIYLFNNTYTMTLQSVQYPTMKFIFNTGSKNNIEPLENMGYFNDSLTKSSKVNDNIPVIYPVSPTTGYIYQKPTADASGYIWFFNTNWNKGYSLNANGIAIPAGNYNNPVYNSSANNVTVAASGNIQAVTAVPANDFNGPYVNHVNNQNNSGTKSLEISVTDGNGNAVAGQFFNVVNSSGTTVATNVETNSNGNIWLYNLPEDTYTITPADDTGFNISETVIDGESAPVANLVYTNQSYSAPVNSNPTTGTINVDLPQGDTTSSVALYQNGQYMETCSTNGESNVVTFSDLPNALYTVATVDNGYISSAQVAVGINSTNETASTSFYDASQITTGNLYAESEDANGNPLSGTTFELCQNGEPVQGVSSETTDGSGTVEFSNIPFGNYTIEAISGPNSGQSQGVDLSNSNYTSWSYFTESN